MEQDHLIELSLRHADKSKIAQIKAAALSKAKQKVGWAEAAVLLGSGWGGVAFRSMQPARWWHLHLLKCCAAVEQAAGRCGFAQHTILSCAHPLVCSPPGPCRCSPPVWQVHHKHHSGHRKHASAQKA